MIVKLIKKVFSRNATFIIIMLLQVAFWVLSVLLLKQHYTWVYGTIVLVNLTIIVYITSSKQNPSYKMVWIILIAVVPVFGGLTYLFLKTRLDSRHFYRMYCKKEDLTKHFFKSENNKSDILEIKDKNISAYNLTNYIYSTGFPVYKNTDIIYYPLGENQFEAMKKELKKAEKFIFMEYFIVSTGVLWDEILEILKERSAAGVDVRLMVDGIGTQFFNMSGSYLKNIEKNYGIQCKVFNPFRPFLSSVQNNRDHRKITVIDGKIAFNGGTNIADEYINEKVRFGHWKDTAIMLKGEAVWSFTMLFLQLWDMNDTENQMYEIYKPDFSSKTVKSNYNDCGYVQPFGDNPITDEHIGAMVYLDLINNAKNYVYITTPYLIPDHELITALKLAARKGVDVRIILPHIPDKWYVYEIAWNYYSELIESGVKIFEYTPGFIHAKHIIVDDELAVIGTINFDYRSLYLHFECGSLMYKCNAISDMLSDFYETQEKSERITIEDCKNRPFYQKAFSYILGLFAPLL